MTTIFAQLETPIGSLSLISNGTALCKVSLMEKGMNGDNRGVDSVLSMAVEELQEYFHGERRSFTCPLYLEGTNFQRKIWGLVQRIPYGETRTYGELALGHSHPRPVGQALKKNPLPIFIPCHRVVGKGGLTGFGMGLLVKRFLLHLESTHNEGAMEDA